MALPSIPPLLKQNGKLYNLDLAYILPNVAACSAPTDKPVKRLYKNDSRTLSKVLTLNHGKGNWVIMNLRTEKIGYDPEILVANGGSFDHRPFLDNNAIPFDQIIQVVNDMDAYLSQDPQKTVIVHCRHGKGRTGSIIVAYLIYKYNLSFEEANRTFTKRRKIYRHGVSVPSQVRYLEYFEQYLRLKECRVMYNHILSGRPTVTVTKLIVHDLTWNPKIENLRINFHVFGDNGAKLDEVLDISERTTSMERIDKDLVLVPKNPLQTNQMDISFQFTMTIKSVTIFMLWLWINVAMEKAILKLPYETVSTLDITIPWERMDGYRGSERRGFKLFESVEFFLQLESP